MNVFATLKTVFFGSKFLSAPVPSDGTPRRDFVSALNGLMPLCRTIPGVHLAVDIREGRVALVLDWTSRTDGNALAGTYHYIVSDEDGVKEVVESQVLPAENGKGNLSESRNEAPGCPAVLIEKTEKEAAQSGGARKVINPIHSKDVKKEVGGAGPGGEYSNINLEEVLKELLDEAVERGLIQDSVVYRDLFDTRLMNCLMPRPAQVQNTFWEKYKESPEEATDYFYKLSQDSDYIRRYRVKKDQKWTVDSPYGTMDITINLSKPEKDPEAIAAAKLIKSSSYPNCHLCPENEGYAGRANHPARENHRIIPLTINDSSWGMQYSPYVYYNEHCIVFNCRHTPMKIERNTFIKLFDFVKLVPHYFLGSNADLPIVGGSILSHDQFQGGHYTFAMALADS